jgi:hypothetical protein
MTKQVAQATWNPGHLVFIVRAEVHWWIEQFTKYWAMCKADKHSPPMPIFYAQKTLY